jgi:hypothetical protein
LRFLEGIRFYISYPIPRVWIEKLQKAGAKVITQYSTDEVDCVVVLNRGGQAWAMVSN